MISNSKVSPSSVRACQSAASTVQRTPRSGCPTLANAAKECVPTTAPVASTTRPASSGSPSGQHHARRIGERAASSIPIR